MEIFLFYEKGKKRGNKKTHVYVKGRFQYSCIPLRFGNILRRMHLYVYAKGTSSSTFQPYNMVKDVDKHMAWTQECMKVKHGYTL
jgi:hypothetical protein